MRLPSPGFLIQAFAQVLRRFPATMLCAFIGVFALFVIIDDYQHPADWVRTYMVCLLGLPLLTGLVALAESKGWDNTRSWLLQGIGLLCLAAYWFWLNPDADGFEYRELPGYLALLLVAHLLVAVAPYLNDRSVRDFWEFNKELFANIVVGASFSFILFAGLSLAILAVDQLFDIIVSEKIYLRLFFLLAGIFNTAYFLFHFPKNYSFDTDDSSYTAIFKNLCKFILIPIVGLYFLILYAYSFKIIGTWTLPRGWVGSLVTGFSVAGIFTYLLNFYLPEQDTSRQVHAYRRWFWWVLLPLTVLLMVAIGQRISDYGVTEQRFLVAQIGVWLALICLYFLIAKKDNIKFIPISLAIFACSWAFGPFNAKAVSERSQLSRMTQILQQTGRLKDGKMVPGTTPVTELESDQFQSCVNFLQDRKRLEILTPMLPKPVDSLPEVSGYYGSAGRLRAWLGMGTSSKEASDQKTVNVYSPTPLDGVDIRGYATFKAIALNSSSEITLKQRGDYFQLTKDGKSLEWLSYDGKTTNVKEKFDLQPFMKQWYDHRKMDNTYYELDATARMIDLVGKKSTVRLVVENGMAEMGSTGLSMGYLNGFLFTK